MDINFKGLNDFSNNNIQNDFAFLLAPYDYITLRPDPLFKLQSTVELVGEVNYPGSYVLTSSRETLSDIINRSGGLKANAFKEASMLIRGDKKIHIDLGKIIKKPRSSIDIDMMPGDRIEVFSRPNIIQIFGEVNAPGDYKHRTGKRVNDIIDQAGGFTEDANKNDIFIRYPNGKSTKYHRWMKNVKVIDGSIIEVGKKPEEEPFDKTEYMKELTSIFANLAQTISIILIARQ